MWLANIFSIDLALVAKRLLITGVNDAQCKRDTVQQALEYVRKKMGYAYNHTARCGPDSGADEDIRVFWDIRGRTDVSKQRSASIFTVIKSIGRNIPEHLTLHQHH